MADKVLPELKRFNLVICDESHNLRNSSTIAYEAILYEYIRRNSSKVLFNRYIQIANVASQLRCTSTMTKISASSPRRHWPQSPGSATKSTGKSTHLPHSDAPTTQRTGAG